MSILLKKKTEEEIVRDSFHRICKKKSIRARREVPLLGRCVDLVYLLGNQLIAVEFKLFDWKRALKQSYDYKLGADFAYICILKRKITDNMQEEVRRAGVGLVFYREKGRWPFDLIINAPRSNETWPPVRSRITSYLNNTEGD